MTGLVVAWPPVYGDVIRDRIVKMKAIGTDPNLIHGAKLYYAKRPIEFINHWIVTYDPRTEGKILPFILFRKQEEFILFLQDCLEQKQAGLVEKSRDVGASYLAAAFSIWLWLFHPNSAIGWGSRKEDLLDNAGDMSSVFPKMKQIIAYLPPFLKPKDYNPRIHATHMKIINPENGSTIIGEAGDSQGRGGRTSIYIKDESAHYEHPELIEAALSANTDVQIDISSVNGTNNVFYRRRMAGEIWSPGAVIARGKTRVFIFDWRDNPLKSQVWYDEKRKKWEDDGLLHIFAQEVDRDYAASITGVIIPATWVKAAIDAHIKLGFNDTGVRMAGLDVADEGGDKNALAVRYGVVLRHCSAWGEGDTGETARRALGMCRELGVTQLNYDCIGVGAGVKAETNRLIEEANATGKPLRIDIVPFNAGAGTDAPDNRVIPGDTDSPTNDDFFSNLKAQTMWGLRQRFEKTYKMVTQGIVFPHEELISIDSTMPNLHELVIELSQPTRKHDGRGRVQIEKKPNGGKSPNLCDAVVQCYWDKISTGWFS